MTRSIYKIDPERDFAFAMEFLDHPVGHHSAGLQRILNVFRGEPLAGKYVLICTKPYQEWQLARLTGERGKPVNIVEGIVFTDLETAEREVFRLRWKEHTGRELATQ
jgi:hypothetical protein